MDSIEDGPRNLGEQFDELLYRWDEARRRPVVIAVLAVAAILLLTASWLLARDGSETPLPVDDRIPQVSLIPATVPTTTPAVLLVHVTGAVQAEGVYELPAGARVMDAIAAAGGATAVGQADRLNLAAAVADGMQIRVPVEGEAAAVVSDGDGDALVSPVNLNTATAAQLESLPGVGPATAMAILSYREERGGFSQVSDLLGVRGIGEAKLAVIEDLVAVQ